VSRSTEVPRAPVALRLREGRAPVRERLTAMLFLTALLHAILILGVGFGGGLKLGQDVPQLDVLLVTNQVPEARSNEQAAYLAQRTQVGSGNTDARSPVGSPASRGALVASSERHGDDERSSSAASTSHLERVLATTAAAPDIRYFDTVSEESAAAAAMPELLGDTAGEPRSGRGDAVELLLRGKDSGEHWISPDTRASTLAPYLAEWKRKVERVGTLNFPTAARQSGLSGSPVVEVEIEADGRLREARVRRTSGFGALDEAALMILKLASPFNPFPPEVAAEYSRLRFAYQWDFVAGTMRGGVAADPIAEPTGHPLDGAAAAPAGTTASVSANRAHP
jgi:protein TonB